MIYLGIEIWLALQLPLAIFLGCLIRTGTRSRGADESSRRSLEIRKLRDSRVGPAPMEPRRRESKRALGA